jgi:hypothetical protein
MVVKQGESYVEFSNKRLTASIYIAGLYVDGHLTLQNLYFPIQPSL